jgi:hypothetical protein
MMLFMPIHDRVWLVWRHLLEECTGPFKGLVAGPVGIDVFHSSAIGIGQLIWRYAYNRSIFGVKLIVAPVDLTTLGGDNVWEAETTPE